MIIPSRRHWSLREGIIFWYHGPTQARDVSRDRDVPPTSRFPPGGFKETLPKALEPSGGHHLLVSWPHTSARCLAGQGRPAHISGPQPRAETRPCVGGRNLFE